MLKNLDIVKFLWVVLFLHLSLVPETDKVLCDIVNWLDLLVDPLIIARPPPPNTASMLVAAVL